MSNTFDTLYITAFVEATQNVFQTMLRQELKFGKPVPGKFPHLNNEVSGIIGMTGDVEGTIVLSLPGPSAEKIVEAFVGSKMDTASEDFADAVGELVNMISGGAKAKFEGKDVRIGCPSVVIGEGHTVQQLSGSVCISIPCESACGSFSVDISMKKAEEAQASQPAAA